MHDAQELTEHLQLSCAMIRRHRSRMIPGGIGYSDNPTFGGFGPKSPCNESAMEMGDLEAAFVGNLARYCIARGSIPAIPLKGFWWVNGVCRGVGGSGMDEDEIGFFDGQFTGYDYLHKIRKVVNHLIRFADEVMNTTGVEDILSAGEDTRWYSLKMFPMENPSQESDWVTLEEAMELTGRTSRTLINWSESGSVDRIGEGRDAIYSRADIEAHMQVVRENMMRSIDALNKNRWKSAES